MTIIDLPAVAVDDDLHFIFDSTNLSTPDTGTEMVLDNSAQPLRIDWEGSDPSTGVLTLPDPPPGALVAMTYVVIAYAEASETLTDPSGWSPDTPNPTQAPFLMIESSRSSLDGSTLDPIPVGAYAGETVWALNDLDNSYLNYRPGPPATVTPANRMWLQSYSDIPIHVAYAAVRLTYVGASITGETGETFGRFWDSKGS